MRSARCKTAFPRCFRLALLIELHLKAAPFDFKKGDKKGHTSGKPVHDNGDSSMLLVLVSVRLYSRKVWINFICSDMFLCTFCSAFVH